MRIPPSMPGAALRGRVLLSAVGGALLAASVLAGEGLPDAVTDEDKALRIAVGRPFYESGRGTPAEFATSQRGQLNLEGRILLGQTDGLRAEAVRKLAELYDLAQIGFAWKEPRPSADVPRLTRAPAVDAALDDDEWRGAARWRGEYFLNDAVRAADRVSDWRMGWHDGRLYVGFSARDANPVAFSGTSGERPRMHEGDAFEFFIRPVETESSYYEFIVNPDGALWPLKHVRNVWGKYLTLADPLPTDGMEYAARRDADGFAVEMSFPLAMFHGVWCGRAPRPGDRFEFMMVRTDRDGDRHHKSAPVPFLYDGHNVFGYIQARLAAADALRK